VDLRRPAAARQDEVLHVHQAITDRHSVAEKFGVNVQRAWFGARARLAIIWLSCCTGDTSARARVALDCKYFDASKMGR
jgi:hypothetical protein